MNDQDKIEFEEYFQLAHRVDFNLQSGRSLSVPVTDEEFESMIPLPFKMASEMKGVEQNMLRPLRQLGDAIEPLADYLKAQSRKIDLMMSYILQAQDDMDTKMKTVSYGGGGFTFVSDSVLNDNDWYTCKLFFSDEATAVYCLVRVIKSTQIDTNDALDLLSYDIQDDQTEVTNWFKYTMLFHKIRDEDRELVVRASLHQQSKQLLRKTKQRESEKS